MEQECARHGWSAQVALEADRVRFLVEVPVHAPRDAVVARLREIATEVARRAGAGPRVGQVWEEKGWCSVLTNGPAVEAVRRHIHDRAAAARGSGGYTVVRTANP